MNINDWKLLLGKIPAGQWGPRKPASLDQILAVESLVGQKLPRAFRSFLLCSNGAKFGERLILGTMEIIAFLRKGHSLPGLQGSCAPIRKKSGLLPFHPVSRSSYECFDLRDPEAPVLWVRIASSLSASSSSHTRKGGFREAFYPPFDRGKGLVMEPTYGDFLDWFLDLLWTLHLPEKELALVTPRIPSSGNGS